MMHRLVALLSAVALIHLSVASGDVACATHGAAARAGATGAHGMAMGAHEPEAAHAAPAAAHASERAAADAPPCDTPVQPDCCTMHVGCSVSTVLASAREAELSRSVATARVVPSRHDRPASFAAAPEPPPPRG